ncbi:exonuclease domain-containing protein [Vibrio mangrovi]|uniref:DNA polymerase III PolC-type n=1 Tax=Vibrio mangrovi TaxID=474394 RepID=A0A1Y6ITT9_9VIBR|nr:exonuclease domain-containing protein [Vibrio mangrovi]MDW6004784.1 exonuclease domain-containing protein [Vibrio mangrovi]SMS01075.1 DNA polymerase III PolC-type [Vibrio mangrovi]
MLTRWLKRWKRVLGAEIRRQRVEPAPHWPAPLKNYLLQPFADAQTPLSELQFLAVDFETTGLSPARDQILSIGMVDLTLEGIDIASTEEILLNHGEFVKAESAQINGLTPKILQQGITLSRGINRLLERAQGKVLLAHHCQIENSFITAFLQNNYNLSTFPVCFIDTLQIEKRFSYAGRSRYHESYQLNDLRSYYHLPDYLAHSAASDAFACAELFLVQAKKLNLQQLAISQLTVD